jgi:putative oxidoreductase
MPLPLQSDAAGKLLLRITLGGLLLFHGVAKILNPGFVEPIVKGVTSMGLPGPFAYMVYVGEVVAPLMILLGLWSRIGGLIVVINMIFAVVMVHTAQLFTLSKTGGWALELQFFYLLCGLAVFFLGSGRAAIKPD